MSDDAWRRRGLGDDDDFGRPLFDEPRGAARGGERGLSFGDHDAEPLPHWTEPPTGELPDVLATGQHDAQGGPGGHATHDDVDVWSSFSDQGPAWSDEPTNPQHSTGRQRRTPSFDDLDELEDLDGLSPRFDDTEPPPTREQRFDEPRRGLFDDDAPIAAPGPHRGGGFDPAAFDEPDQGLLDEGVDEGLPPRRREQGRIQIGTDPTDGAARPPLPQRGRPRPGEPQRGPRPPRPGGVRPPAPRPVGGTKGRDMPTAIVVGVIIAAAFIVSLMIGPSVVYIVITIVLGMAGAEFFDRVREKSYEPATVPGLAACIAAPLVAYHYGAQWLGLVTFFAFAACAVTYIGARSLESNPMPNMAISMLGIVWIGILGAHGAAIVGLSNIPFVSADGIPLSVGTDTLAVLAVAVVANDVGALFVGSAVGKSPLRAWISPNKSIEGFVGGTLTTLGAMVLVGITGRSDTWNSTGDLLLPGLVVAFTAPIGDLTESMFKRNLDVKDFGSIIKGHGGLLDRFDGFLFAMPATYYLVSALQPWVTK